MISERKDARFGVFGKKSGPLSGNSPSPGRKRPIYQAMALGDESPDATKTSLRAFEQFRNYRKAQVPNSISSKNRPALPAAPVRIAATRVFVQLAAHLRDIAPHSPHGHLQLRKLNYLTKMSQNEMPDIHRLDEYLACAHALADTAAEQTLRYFRQGTAVENKADSGAPAAKKRFDPVTAADRGAEKAIRSHLAERFPDHGMHGEEFGLTHPDSRYRWVVDPIDGTAAFIMGWPMWGTLIALTDSGRPLLGLMDQPFTRERFWSTATNAIWQGPDNQQRILETRPCASIDEAALSTTHPDYFTLHRDAQAFERVKQAARTTRFGGDCYAYAMLASGFCDLIVESGLQAYDVAALIPIVEKAGGTITTWSGETAAEGGNIVAAGDVRVHQAALELLSS